MYRIIIVGIGGFIGSALRYIVSGYIQDISHSISFPYGTLSVNIIGCFLMGMISQLVDLQIGITSETRLFLMVGVLGGFTTFSAFGNETIKLLQDQRIFLSLMYIGSHIFICLLAVFAGMIISKYIWR
ncbi:MAG: fluoride efflux transporter CrcB [Deltaproteobacteria bacterium]|nr:fluoride efflux transporter CrcB [Deltaproteobacteria bacterium]